MGILCHWTATRLRRCAAACFLAVAAACITSGLTATAARAGPCTAQIAQLQEQIKLATPGPTTGPTAPQSVDAQLHHQPTPGSVEHAETSAQAEAEVALDRARKADAEGNVQGCDEALRAARKLYGID